MLLLAVLSSLDSATRVEAEQQDRHQALLGARAAMTIITKDVRQALWVDPSSTANRLSIQTLQSGTERAVVYVRSGNTLTRSVGESAAQTMVDNLLPSQTFCYHFVAACEAAEPGEELSSIRITIKVSPEPTGAPITLATDVKLRNL